MKIWVYTLLLSFLLVNHSISKTLEQKKVDLKKALNAGAITKTEFNKDKDFLENPDKNKQEKKSFLKKKLRS